MPVVNLDNEGYYISYIYFIPESQREKHASKGWHISISIPYLSSNRWNSYKSLARETCLYYWQTSSVFQMSSGCRSHFENCFPRTVVQKHHYQASSISMSWDFLEMPIIGALIPDPQNQNSRSTTKLSVFFNKPSWWFWSRLRFENQGIQATKKHLAYSSGSQTQLHITITWWRFLKYYCLDPTSREYDIIIWFSKIWSGIRPGHQEMVKCGHFPGAWYIQKIRTKERGNIHLESSTFPSVAYAISLRSHTNSERVSQGERRNGVSDMGVWVMGAQLLNHVWLGNAMNCSLPGSSVHWIFQARILEWVAISSSKESSWLKDRTSISGVSCIVGRFFTTEPPGRMWVDVTK